MPLLPLEQHQIESHSSLEEALAFYLDNPVAWAQDIIGCKLDDWQQKLLQAVSQDRYVAVRSGHGVGKSFSLSVAILWFLLTHPFSKVVCTAPTKEQLYDVLWAQLSNLIRESKNLSDVVLWEKEKISVKSHPEEWFAVARTAEVRKLGKTGLAVAEGLQGRHAEAILYVLDEASGIDEAIMSTVDGALTSEDSSIIMTGNPTRSSGTFYDAFHTKRKLWKTFHVNSENSPRVAKSWCERMLEKYGSRDHPLYLIRVRGDFPPAQHNSLFNLDTIESSSLLPIQATRFDPYEIGVDVARYGGDYTSFCVKHGPEIERIDNFAQQSTMETAGRCIQYINQYKPYAVRIDVVGVGAGVYDRLRELGYKECLAINGGYSPNDEKQFANLRAESHWYLRTLLEQKRLKLPKDDDDLVSQMTSITYKVTSKGKILVESKEELRDRGVRSPDRLDALVLATMPAYQPVRRASATFVPFMAR